MGLPSVNLPVDFMKQSSYIQYKAIEWYQTSLTGAMKFLLYQNYNYASPWICEEVIYQKIIPYSLLKVYSWLLSFGNMMLNVAVCSHVAKMAMEPGSTISNNLLSHKNNGEPSEDTLKDCVF